MLLRVCPPRPGEAPPTTILPSACTARAWNTVVRPWVEGRVQRAVGVEPPDVVARLPAQLPKLAPHHDLAIRLHRQSVNVPFAPG